MQASISIRTALVNYRFFAFKLLEFLPSHPRGMKRVTKPNTALSVSQIFFEACKVVGNLPSLSDLWTACPCGQRITTHKQLFD